MSVPESPNRQGRRRFHLALAGIFMCVAPAISWVLAARQPKTDSTPWRRRLFALANADSFVFFCFMLLTITTMRQPAKPEPFGGGLRIGVLVAPRVGGDGVAVLAVTPASPAEVGGLRAEDAILTLDGAAVHSSQELSTALSAGAPGASRRLQVRREAVELDVYVTPALRVGTPNAGSALFARRAVSVRSWSAGAIFEHVGGALAALVVLAVAGIVGRLRGARVTGLLLVAGALIVSHLASFVVSVAFDKTLGASLGSALVGMIASGLTMLGIALLATRRPRGDVRFAGELLGALPALGLGIFYVVTGVLRVALVVAALVPLLHLPNHPAAEVFGVSRAWGTPGVLMFFFAAVFVAPVAEECLFRGVLLPWMTTWMKPWTAIGVSSLAFGVGHLFYGASMLIPLFYGVVLGFLRMKTGTLRASIGLHMLINATALVLMLFVNSE